MMSAVPTPDSNSAAPSGGAESAPHFAEIDQIFSERGAFANAVPEFRSRPQQVEMAKMIAQAITQQGTCVLEAGTGTGKTFAYLVPALMWGGKVILSTGTKTLQDQLFQRDLPQVRQVLNVPVTIALLKGRANYVCHYYLQRASTEGQFASKRDAQHLQRIVQFTARTKTGDKAESGVPDDAPIWGQVTSTRENCLGQQCGYYKDCFVMQARKQALEADVVVVNHHLFFADLALRDGGVAELLPSANTVIFDEAHQLPETATTFFGTTLSSTQFLELSRDTLVEGRSHARDGADWLLVTSALEQAVRDWRLLLGGGAQRWSWQQLQQQPFYAAFGQSLQHVTSKLADLCTVLSNQANRHEALNSCYERATALQQALQAWQTAAQEYLQGEVADLVLWVETTLHALQLHATPLSIAEPFTRERSGRARAWVFTSATLAMRRRFDHYQQQLGLQDAQTQCWESPFDYAQQAMLYVPQQMPLPHQPHYLDEVLKRAWPLIAATQGGVFFLCTTLRAVERVASLLEQRLQADSEQAERPLLVQGTWGRSQLLEKFRASGRAILVGSQSFWEGVDVAGTALSLVIIDKLPFAPPDDPVLAARLQALEAEGGNPFMDYQVPQAVLSLKQGAGRLIRSEQDKGVLMIADTRLVDKPYGRLIWQSLPPFRRSRQLDEVLAFIQENITTLQREQS